MTIEKTPVPLIIAANQKKKEKNYWLNKLSGFSLQTSFPVDSEQAQSFHYCLESIGFSFPNEMLQPLKDISKNSHERLFIVLAVGVFVLVQKYSGTKDIILGIPVPKPTASTSIMNLALPIRGEVEENDSFRDLLSKVRQTIIDAVDNQNFPIYVLPEFLNLQWREGESFPLFDVVVALKNIHQESLREFFPQIIISFESNDCQLKGDFFYNPARYKRNTIEQLISHYQRLLKEVLKSLDNKISLVELLSQDEKRQIIVSFNDTAADFPINTAIYELVDQQAGLFPQANAVVYKDQKISYSELKTKSDHIGRVLRQNGLQPEQVVAVLFDHSPEMVITLMGILKSGAAYLPIAADLPQKRIEYIIKDSGARYIITIEKYLGPIMKCRDKLLIYSQLFDNNLSMHSLTDEKALHNPGHLAYIMYTSGSTGKPKGVMIENRSFSDFTAWAVEVFEHKPGYQVLLSNSYASDGSIQQIFPTLISGGTLHLIDKELRLDVSAYLDYLKKNRINNIDEVPVLMNELLGQIDPNDTGENLPDLTCLSLGSEYVPMELVRKCRKYLNHHGRIINAYGPAEASVETTFYYFDGTLESEVSLIGKPRSNTRVYILDEVGNCCPIGVNGEICISGAGLTRGYINKPELSAQKIVSNSYSNIKNDHLYKTGDRGCWLPDGNIRFFGRIDDQVKIRGNRVELSEIEYILKNYKGINDAVALIRENRKGEPEIHGYYVDGTRLNAVIWPSVGEYPLYDEYVYYAMTNDKARNERYQAAIRRHVEGKVVVEIGTGQDVILARFCVEANARKIYAIEISEDSFKKACQKIRELKLQDKIILIHGDAANVELPEKADICLSEIIGTIGGSEGAAAILENARRFLKNDGIMIPEKCITRIAAVQLPPGIHRKPSFSKISAQYVEKLFKYAGRPFDFRVCIDNFPVSSLISNDGVFENLIFGEHIGREQQNNVELIILDDARLDGFILWLNLYTAPGELIDNLKNRHCWASVFIPAMYPGINVSRGDKINLKCSWSLSRNGVNPDYKLAGNIILKDGTEIPIQYDLPYFETKFRKNPFYKELLIDNASGYVSNFIEYLDLDKLEQYLQSHLPSYMIPARLIELEKIPLTPNGKVDRNALPAPEEGENKDYVLPGNIVEKKLVEIWEKVLGREHIGINQNFFMIGGDSIKSIQIISRMRSAGYKLEMKDLFQYPAISKLAPYVKKLKPIPAQSIITGTVPLTPVQRSFFNECTIDPHHYNQAVMFYASAGIDKEAIKKVFTRIQEHHDALRITYKIDANIGEVLQINHGYDYPLSIQEYNLKSLAELNEKVNEIQEGIDLEKGPLMKLGLFHLEDGDRLLIVIHHLVIDGVSWRILLEDIASLYDQILKGQKMVLPSKTDSFKLWADLVKKYADSEKFLKERAYWQKVESASAEVHSIPKDSDMEEAYIKDKVDVSFMLGEKETELLLTRINHVFRTEINDILLTALGLALKKTFGQKRLLIALEGHGREELLENIDVSRTVGWFTSIYPVLLDFSFAHDLGRQIKEVKELLRKIPNKGIGYGILKYLTGEENKKQIKFKSKPQISFNYLGQFDAEIKQISSFEIAKESLGRTQSRRNRMTYEIDVVGIIANNRLSMHISYPGGRFRSETIAVLAGHFESELKQIIAVCCSKQNIEYTPCDFTYKELSIEMIDRLLKDSPDLEDIYTLAPMQEGMLFQSLRDKRSYSYFEQTSYRLKGELDIPLVEKSLNELFKRHDILRTTFIHDISDRPVQLVLKDRQCDFYFREITGLGETIKKEDFIAEFKEKDKARGFDLTKDVLMRISILKVDNSEYEFCWSFHHILMDGWCIGILNAEFFEIYNSFLEKRLYLLPEIKLYRTYIQWLDRQDREKSILFWNSYLKAFAVQTGVPKSKVSDERNIYKNETVSILLDIEKTAGLNKLAGMNSVTLNNVMQAIWGIFLGIYNGKEDVVFGSVVSGRPSELEGVESIVGLFINTIPVRIQFDERMKFIQLIQVVQNESLASELYHYHPLAEIQSMSILKQNLIDHIFIFENYPIVEKIKEVENEGKKSNKISVKLTDIKVFEQTNYDFNIILDSTDRLRIRFQYNGNVYDKVFIDRIAHNLCLMVDQVLENQGLEIREFTFLSEEEKIRILFTFNDTKVDYPESKTIHQLFEDQVERSLDNIALVGPSIEPNQEAIQITYKVLNEKSNRLACKLQIKGIQTNNIIGIMIERSVEMIIGIFGILKAKGAYLPIDPEYPKDRIDYMLKDSGAKLLTSKDFKELPYVLSPQICYSHISLISNLAYVIYTSGSTGKPKGVIIQHKSLINFLKGITNVIPFSRNDCVLSLTTFSFDIFFLETILPITNGAKVVIGNKGEQVDIRKIGLAIEREYITIFQVIPTRLKLIISDKEAIGSLKRIKHLLVGGEEFSQALFNEIRKSFETCKIYNVYGPTESTVWSTLKDLTGEKIINIGKPIANTQVFILSKNGNPQLIGISGELCIGGDGLASGYLNKPQLTEEKFVYFTIQLERLHGPKRFTKMIYKTGDLARWLPDGNIQFLGRIDRQVKIRGIRIELEEIENQMLKHAEIKEAVLLDKKDQNGNGYLAAYFVSNRDIPVSELRQYLLKQLPAYMIPAYFIRLEKIPLTPSGKIDRKALPDPGITFDESYTPPRNMIEEKIVSIWAEVLGIPDVRISIDSNFFDLGGHSLTAIKLLTKIHRELNASVPLAEMFKNSTIKGLAKYIDCTKFDKFVPLEYIEKKEYYIISSAQKRLYISQQAEIESVAYNMPYLLSLEGIISKNKLEETFRKLISRHESLRTSFELVEGRPVQRVHDRVDFKMEYYDTDTENPKNSTEIIENFIRFFDLSKAPLLRIGLIKKEKMGFILMIDIHHIITDGISQDILIKDFISIYAKKELSSLKFQYKEYSEWMQTRGIQDMLSKQKKYWIAEFQGEIPFLTLPIDYPRLTVQSFEGDIIRFELNVEETKLLNEIAHNQGSTLFIVILAIYNILLSKLSANENVVIGVPIANRRHVDLEEIIGMFVNTLAIQNYPTGEKSFNIFLDEVKEKTINAFENQDYPFENIVESIVLNRDMSRNPLFDAMLIFQNFFNVAGYNKIGEEKSAGMKIKPYPYKHKASKFDLTLSAFEMDKILYFSLVYCTKLFKEKTILRFIDYLKQIIKSITANLYENIADIEIISLEARKDLINSFNEPLKEAFAIKPIQIKLADVFQKYNGNTAIECGMIQKTYAELEQKAACIFNCILKSSIKKGSFIGILIEDKIEIISAIIAVLNMGCVFITLDITLPVKRIETMIRLANIQVILTDTAHENVILGNRDIKHILRLDDLHYLNTHMIENRNYNISYKTEDKIYVYFTSGTTGLPNAIIGKNESLVQFIEWEINTFSIDEIYRVSQLTSVGFDAFLRDIFVPLFVGGVICIPSKHDKALDNNTLIDWLDSSRINLVHCVPSLFRIINSEELTGTRLQKLKYVVLSGEPINPNILRKWYHVFGDRIRLVNYYGSTETTMIKMYHFIQMGDVDAGRIPAGRPMRGTRAIILDKYMKVCDRGIIGEIYIRTAYGTYGYLDKPILNAQRFIKNPFQNEKGDVIFKTGDLARELENGEIEILGRIDRQVKIRGVRIELENIENCLLKHVQIDKSIVTSRKDNNGENYLCAYILYKKRDPGNMDRIPTAIELRDHLAKELPEYMIPSYFVPIEKIQLTPNGKIDLEKLPEPELKIDGYIAPGNRIEEKLVELWAQVLNIEKKVISMDSNVFDLGAHSLNALLMIAHIHKEFNVKVTLAQIFKLYTISTLAKYLKEQEVDVYVSMEPVEKKESYEVSFNQKRLWIIQQMNPRDNSFNMVGNVEINEAVEEGLIKQTVAMLFEIHESLRTGFKQIADTVFQYILEDFQIPFESVDISSFDEERKGVQCEKLLNEFHLKPFNLDSPPLYKSLLVKIKEEKYLYAYNIHHIVSDAWSMNILERDFRRIYSILLNRQPIDIRNEITAIKYKDFAHWHNRLLSDDKNNKISREFWCKFLTEELPPLRLPQDFQYNGTDKQAGMFRFAIPGQIKEALKETGKEHSLTLFTLLFSIYNIFLSVFSGEKIIVSSIVNFGREHPSLHNIVGFFVNAIAFKKEINFDMIFIDFTKEIQQSVLEFFQHQNYPLELVLDEVGRKYPIINVSFNMINGNHITGSLDLKNFDSFHIFEKQNPKFDLEYYVFEYRNGIEIRASYNKKLFKPTNIEFLMDSYRRMVDFFAVNPNSQLKNCIEKKGRVFKKML